MASVHEFMNVWDLGGESSLNLTTSGGVATVSFKCSLGHPGAPHSLPNPSPPPHPPHPPPPHVPPHRPRHRGPAERERNRLRAACHQATRVQATAPVTASVMSAVSAPVTATVTASSASFTASVSDTIPAAETSDSEELPEIALSQEFSIDFKCDQCEYTNINENGIAQHKRMKHRMLQVDGVTDFDEDLYEHSATVMDSLESESENEKIDWHIKSIPLEKLKKLVCKRTC